MINYEDKGQKVSSLNSIVEIDGNDWDGNNKTLCPITDTKGVDIRLRSIAHLLVERVQVESLTAEEAIEVLKYVSDVVIPAVIPNINHTDLDSFMIIPPKDVLDYMVDKWDLGAGRIYDKGR